MTGSGKPERIVHEISPVYDTRSRVLVLGTMPSPKSREAGFFYGHPQNRFWRVMASILKSPLPRTTEEKRALMLENRIALWDVLHSCMIEGAGDASIRDAVPNDLTPILRAADIRAVFTTGTKAFALYNRYIRPNVGREAIPLPSTSPANCAQSLESLCGRYAEILTYLEELP
ncbi:DNA-deoxyinosine glycosylase [Marasmitruncus massiliensis]|jgi:hypoxanthine-DNA glycosylase|uniref:DNA-deoxyinosine glycosylase n=1 Tax=Marasmitruncus massiliensis TaxID=1944642 RepID=UPI000C7CC365|nr:DNA-deoxyinosine glycosylase [Marasmitruncus massiliensis]MBE6906285.1 DNA-deoxyinosine glycosylase [Oscillospiraceae bacterium]